MTNNLNIDDNTVIHCPTEEKFVLVLTIAKKLGCEWNGGSSLLNGISDRWNYYQDSTCFDMNRGQYSPIDEYIDMGYTIMSADDFLKLYNNEPETIAPGSSEKY